MTTPNYLRDPINAPSPFYVPAIFWVWELTLLEYMHGNVVRDIGDVGVAAVEQQGLPKAYDGIEAKALPGVDAGEGNEPYTIQLCRRDLSDDNAYEPGEAPPVAPKGRNPGMIVLQGETVVASMVFTGRGAGVSSTQLVHADHRQKGISTAMNLEWAKATKRGKIFYNVVFTPDALSSSLSGYNNLLQWAIDEDKPVPANVRDAFEAGEQAQQITELIEAVAAGGPKARVLDPAQNRW